jgi:hypothetical protein
MYNYKGVNPPCKRIFPVPYFTFSSFSRRIFCKPVTGYCHRQTEVAYLPIRFVESGFCGWTRTKTVFQATKQSLGVEKKVIIDPKWEIIGW